MNQILAMLITASPLDVEIAGRVAREYHLNAEQTAVLCAIRLTENGRAGCEYGVERAKARRFAGDPPKSIECQARWAAGTIKKRWTGDLEIFCDRNWKPKDRENWLHNMRWFLSRWGY
jgi:hypothetical protein